MKDIPSKILRTLKERKKTAMADLVREFSISRQAIHRYLKNLLKEKKVLKQGSSRKTSFYILNPSLESRSNKSINWFFKKRYPNKKLEEEFVFSEITLQKGFPRKLSSSLREIFHYAFTEMLNNAIDHSRSRSIEVLVETRSKNLFFSIGDSGVGIFENIRSKKKLKNEMEALQDLLKGKQTTIPARHSGEGIFFTSKIADLFWIESHRKRLVIDNQIPDIFVEDIPFKKGTQVSFEIAYSSKKQLRKIFNQYSDEDFQFSKTQIVVKLYKEGVEYISRSQAKRLLEGLTSFKEIVLDFKGIRTIGQGFADEIFRVFASEHPKIKLTPIHCHENVEFMIRRAKNQSI